QVEASGTLKLLDFGIARVLRAELDSENPPTGRTERLMTPEYASPEQVAGRRVTTASDIYQLGGLLYELLTGQRPGDRVRPSVAVGRATPRTRPGGTIDTVDPATRSALRQMTPDRLSRRLRGDLDVIVLRALRDEPDSRYPSAEDLAGDIERHLANL